VSAIRGWVQGGVRVDEYRREKPTLRTVDRADPTLWRIGGAPKRSLSDLGVKELLGALRKQQLID